MISRLSLAYSVCREGTKNKAPKKDLQVVVNSPETMQGLDPQTTGRVLTETLLSNSELQTALRTCQAEIAPVLTAATVLSLGPVSKRLEAPGPQT